MRCGCTAPILIRVLHLECCPLSTAVAFLTVAAEKRRKMRRKRRQGGCPHQTRCETSTCPILPTYFEVPQSNGFGSRSQIRASVVVLIGAGGGSPKFGTPPAPFGHLSVHPANNEVLPNKMRKPLLWAHRRRNGPTDWTPKQQSAKALLHDIIHTILSQQRLRCKFTSLVCTAWHGHPRRVLGCTRASHKARGDQ